METDRCRSCIEPSVVCDEFKVLVRKDVAVPVSAMKTLVSVIKRSDATTWMQLEHELREATIALKGLRSSDLGGRTSISLGSGCDLFMKYVTRAFLEFSDFSVCKLELVKRGDNLAGMSLNSRHVIADFGSSFIRDGSTVLVHGSSRVVTSLLLNAAKTKQYNVIFTECRPNNEGLEMSKIISDAGIATTVILDCAVGAVMERVDMCLVGAEGVMENGGIVNKLGTYQVAMIAKALRKPFYVAVESYKFARMYPLTQQDIAGMMETSSGEGKTPSESANVSDGNTVSDSELTGYLPHPSVDFTPAQYITLLFTDLGVLTPAAVSDELIRLYQ